MLAHKEGDRLASPAPGVSPATDRLREEPATQRADSVTVSALLTPPGRSALAVVSVAGPEALDAVAACCRVNPRRLRKMTAGGRLWIGRWRGPEGEPVVVHVHHDDQVEISCHGGTTPAEAILTDLESRGVERISWRARERQTCSGLIEPEALEALTQAPTLRSAAVLLAQYHGALTRRCRELLEWLDAGRPGDVLCAIDQLLDYAQLGLHLVNPWRIAIVGRPNVGKSSLLNALVGFDRAIVHSAPGTTRDWVTAITAIDGWAVELSDSAGIHGAADAIEAVGIERAREKVQHADRQIVVFDRGRPLSEEDFEILRLCARPVLVVNKIDLPPAWDDAGVPVSPVRVSAMTGAGIGSLVAELAQLLVPKPPGGLDAVPFTNRHVAMLEDTKHRLAAGKWREATQSIARLISE